jgi:hypothetical protein
MFDARPGLWSAGQSHVRYSQHVPRYHFIKKSRMVPGVRVVDKTPEQPLLSLCYCDFRVTLPWLGAMGWGGGEGGKVREPNVNLIHLEFIVLKARKAPR